MTLRSSGVKRKKDLPKLPTILDRGGQLGSRAAWAVCDVFFTLPSVELKGDSDGLPRRVRLTKQSRSIRRLGVA